MCDRCVTSNYTHVSAGKGISSGCRLPGLGQTFANGACDHVGRLGKLGMNIKKSPACTGDIMQRFLGNLVSIHGFL